MDVETTPAEVSPPVVKEGDWVLIVDNETKFSFAHATRVATVKMGKRPIRCETLIGAPYGSFFEVLNGKLVPTDPNAQKEALDDLVGDEGTGTAAVDNRDLMDYNNTQGLTQEEVTEMKNAGQKAELVRKLAENSSSWTKRTEYSQEKYIRKKTAKHQVVVQIVRPTAALITKAYFAKKAFRTQHMRPDTIAHIMNLSNLQSGLRTLIIDDCIGLILGTALERANGRGTVYNLHQGTDCNPSALRLFNFSSDQLAPLRHVPIDLMRGTLTPQSFRVDEDENEPSGDADSGAAVTSSADMDTTDADNADSAANTGAATHSMDAAAEEEKSKKKRIDPSTLPPKKKKKDLLPYEKVLEQDKRDGITPEQAAERKRKNHETRRLYRELKWQTYSDTKLDLETRGVDSIIIAGPPHPMAALNSVWRFLNLSGHFVVYSELLQPLVECYEALYRTGRTVNLRLTETWCRTYQVLPKRTHPLNNMSASSGYLLSGIKVEAVDKSHQQARVQHSDKQSLQQSNQNNDGRQQHNNRRRASNRSNESSEIKESSTTDPAAVDATPVDAPADSSSSLDADMPAAKRAKLTESS